jgi:hypothetical protein
LYLNALLAFDILTQLSDKKIHAAAQEIVILAPYLHQDVFTFEHRIAVLIKIAEQLCLSLCKLGGIRGGLEK